MIKVLIVEDHLFTREVIKESLTGKISSLVLEEAANGRETLAKVDSFQPDLIFLDIRLPDESGLKLLEKIKARYPEITIIILSSYNLPEYREFALQHGAASFFSKDEMTKKDILSLVQSFSIRYNQ